MGNLGIDCHFGPMSTRISLQNFKKNFFSRVEIQAKFFNPRNTPITYIHTKRIVESEVYG